MSLRRQLLVVSLLLLTLPWAGCQFVREMESALRHGQVLALQSTNRAIATVLAAQPEVMPSQLITRGTADKRTVLYAAASPAPMIIDGYRDGWPQADAYHFNSDVPGSEMSLTVQALSHASQLYLLIQVRDPEVLFFKPGLEDTANGDRLVLRTFRGEQIQEYELTTSAPGQVRGKQRHPEGHRGGGQIRGYWQDSREGYTLELALPLAMTGDHLGLYVVDAHPGDARRGRPQFTAGNITPTDQRPPPRLVYPLAELLAVLAPFAPPQGQVIIVDPAHWQLGAASAPAPASPAKDSPSTHWLASALYRYILRDDDMPWLEHNPTPGQRSDDVTAAALRGEASSGWYRAGEQSGQNTLVAATPIERDAAVVAAVVSQQSSEPYLSLADQAFGRLSGVIAIAVAAAVTGLLAFASVLSWRIRRLSRATGQVMHADGRLHSAFPRSQAADEIGELSRRYADLLTRLSDYHEYLRSLSHKLSHELRTPIAVIQSSLDNLEQPQADERSTATYVGRARDGLSRLNAILTAMSEATQLEESIRSNERQPFELTQLLADLHGAYASIYPQQHIVLDTVPGPATVLAAPELLAQALDKLMDNASSFCPEGGIITLGLAPCEDDWCLSVSNEGPPLPTSMAGQLFESMVSVRDAGNPGVHLGLGLHIVRLIVDYHEGRVEAINTEDGKGVRCSIFLPRLPVN